MSSERRPYRRLPRIRAGVSEQAQSDVEEELRFHIDMLATELMEAGYSPEQARAEAIRSFGNLEEARMKLQKARRETERRVRLSELLERVRQDTRYALRTLRRSPGFAVAAILTLALGMGANSAMFGMVHAVLLRPLPYAEADRIVIVWENNTREGEDRYAVAPANYADWRAGASAFDGLAGLYRYRTYTLTGLGDAERLETAEVVGDFFGVLGVQAALGRALVPADEQVNGPPLVMLTDGIWRRRFGADRAIVGQTITLTGNPYTVVGVLPPGFLVPTHPDAEIVLPLRLNAEEWQWRSIHFLQLVGRLKPDVTVAQARAQLSTIAARLASEYPESNRGTGVTVLPIRDALAGNIRPALLILFGAVGCVLLVSCANIANLLLARTTARARELAVRTALGASRARITCQILTESTILALAGATAGLLLALWLVRLTRAIAPAELSQLADATIGVPVLVFTLALAFVIGALAGVLPALRAAGARIAGLLQEAGRSAAGRRRERARRALVVAQISLSLILLVGAGLLLRSFQRLQHVDPGFRAEGVLTFNLDKRAAPPDVIRFYDEVIDRIAALPGVTSVGGINQLPMADPGPTSWLTLEGHTWETPTPPEVGFRPVTLNYFEAMGIPLRAGRRLEPADRSDGSLPVLVNETFVRRFLPQQDPLGRRIRLGPNPRAPWRTIIGVVGDTRNVGLAEPIKPDVYIAQAQTPSSHMMLAVRTAGDPLALAAPVRSVVSALDPGVALEDLATLDQVVSRSIADRRFSLVLLGGFAALALLLALVGTYGVLAYMVTQRVGEIGLRMALGAHRWHVVRLVVGEGMVLALTGLVLGAAVAAALTQLMRGMLYEISVWDPATYAGVTLLLAMVTLVASWLPVRRATRLNPTDALRAE